MAPRARKVDLIGVASGLGGADAACAQAPRPGQRGTWISEDMKQAYIDLHRAGHAHSVEVFDGPDAHDSRLVGGIYGVAIGRVFFGESMFSRVTDASKVALVSMVGFLKERQFALIDCQVASRHLESLGAQSIAYTNSVVGDDERRYLRLLSKHMRLDFQASPAR